MTTKPPFSSSSHQLIWTSHLNKCAGGELVVHAQLPTRTCLLCWRLQCRPAEVFKLLSKFFNTLKVADFITIASTVILWKYVQNCPATNLFRHKTEFLRGLQQDHQVLKIFIPSNTFWHSWWWCEFVFPDNDVNLYFLMIIWMCIGRSSCWVWLQQGHFSLFQVGQIWVEKVWSNLVSVGTLSSII